MFKRKEIRYRKTMEKTSEEMRNIFNNSLSYSDIGSKEIYKLIQLINEELTDSDNEIQMKLCALRNKDITYDENGSIKKCFIMVDGFYFKRREAISFNNNGFIGFAGWADTENSKPFINAFEKWVNIVR